MIFGITSQWLISTLPGGDAAPEDVTDSGPGESAESESPSPMVRYLIGERCSCLRRRA